MNSDEVRYLDGYMGVTEKIKRAMFDVCKSYLYIGFLLDEAQRLEYYREKGYASIYEYAAVELNFKKSSVKNFIAVFNEFALVQSGLKTMSLKCEYEKFGYSQLCEMLSLSDAQRKQVNPTNTVREIRQLKKIGQTSGHKSATSEVVPLFGSCVYTVTVSGTVSARIDAYAKAGGFTFDQLVERALSAYLDGLSLNSDASKRA